MDRTMVKMSCVADGFELRTFRRETGESRDFFVSRSTFEDLAEYGYTIQDTPESYVVLYCDHFAGTMNLRYAWINRSGNQLSRWEEPLVLDYKKLMAFVRDSAKVGGPKEWKCLAVPSREAQPRFVFQCSEHLRECLENKAVQRKLIKFLRDNFKWPRAERIEFYSDWVPYSFFFQEYCDGKPGMCGSVILHGQDDMPTAYYSIHT